MHTQSQHIASVKVIVNFGFVTALPESVGSTTVVTAAGALSLAWNRGYLAPEISDGKHGVASDVYSYGVVSPRSSLPCLYGSVTTQVVWRHSVDCWPM